MAQISIADSALIKAANFKEPKYEYNRNVKFLTFRSSSKFVKYNPVSFTAGVLMFVYQKHLSAQMATACPYAVTCSEFSKVAIARFGLLKGVLLTADRLTRCSGIAIKDLDDKLDYTPHTHKIIDEIENYR